MSGVLKYHCTRAIYPLQLNLGLKFLDIILKYECEFLIAFIVVHEQECWNTTVVSYLLEVELLTMGYECLTIRWYQIVF